MDPRRQRPPSEITDVEPEKAVNRDKQTLSVARVWVLRLDFDGDGREESQSNCKHAAHRSSKRGDLQRIDACDANENVVRASVKYMGQVVAGSLVRISVCDSCCGRIHRTEASARVFESIE